MYFLYICGRKGGSDFRLSDEQLTWLKYEVGQTSGRIMLFMHTYPDDLVEQSEKDVLNQIIATNNILLTDVGHTHYNAVANDGYALFTATSAIVFGCNRVKKVICKLSQGSNIPVTCNNTGNVWSANIEVAKTACTKVIVEVFNKTGRPGQHNIKYFPVPITSKTRFKRGSDADAIEAWPENGVFSTQLYPDRNGKPLS